MTDKPVDVVERVAKCIRDARALPGTNPVARLSDVDRRAAKAAIAEVVRTMGERRESMIEAGYEVMTGRYGCSFEVWPIFESMLTAWTRENGVG